MGQILYTTTDEVRAYLGFDFSDAKEALLMSAKLDTVLKMDLLSWLPAHQTIWDEGIDSLATPEQIIKMEVLTLYCQAYVGWSVARKKPLYIQVYTDGKVKMQRYDINLDDVIDMALSDMAKWKDLLLEDTSYTPASIMAISSPAFDPITGA